MANKQKAVYAPGELSRVREKLGSFDNEEAKQLMQKLGGEVGYERSEQEEQAKNNPPRTRNERVEVKIGDRKRPRRTVELPMELESGGSAKAKPVRRKDLDPEDDPLVVMKVSYWDRLKMDKFAGQPEFEIKSAGQIFQSAISLFSIGPDYINPAFITGRMPEYYKKLEKLVVSTRTLFPRNNARRSERLKKSSPLVYLILDAIRYWNIEKISGDLTRLQSNPKNIKVIDFADIIRSFYRPLFILGQMDPDSHIRASFKILFKALYLEDPMEAQNKYQDLIRQALASYFEIRREIHYLLFPLLLKLVSNKYIHYDRFFSERKNRLMSFLNVSEEDQIIPIDINPNQEVGQDEGLSDKQEAGQDADQESQGDNKNTKEGDEKETEMSAEEKARKEAEEADKKALRKGLQTLEALFPKAGWNRIESFPDLFPYFADVFNLKRGVANIAPTDPVQQILILMRILEELFFGLRYVSFGTITAPSGASERVDDTLGEIINNWNFYIETIFEKEYLPRMAEYVRVLEGTSEDRVSPYTKKIAAELHWVKRLYFLPYYKFETLIPPPVQKKDASQLYSRIRTLKKYLTAVARGIEQGNKAGGAARKAPCEGIENPWDAYVFQVPNPLSTRIDAILPPKSRNNAALIFFCLAIVTVLDHIMNDADSWAYASLPGPLFRSEEGQGIIPLTGVDERIDADAIFKQSIKQRQKKA